MSEKAVCGSCMGEFTQKTLKKNGGTCFKCSKKPLIGDSGADAGVVSEKFACSACSKMFTQKTLSKNGGVCGKCATAAGGSLDGMGMGTLTISGRAKEKAACPKCTKEFTVKTLAKYEGMCNRCYTKEMTPPSYSSAFVGIPMGGRA